MVSGCHKVVSGLLIKAKCFVLSLSTGRMVTCTLGLRGEWGPQTFPLWWVHELASQETFTCPTEPQHLTLANNDKQKHNGEHGGEEKGHILTRCPAINDRPWAPLLFPAERGHLHFEAPAQGSDGAGACPAGQTIGIMILHGDSVWATFPIKCKFVACAQDI